MPRRLSDLLNSIAPPSWNLGGSSRRSSSSGTSSRKAPTNPELASWMGAGESSEDRKGAVKAIESAEKYKRKKVDLSRLALARLPAAVSRLATTKDLDLSHNQLQAWPAETAELGDLRKLNASTNKIPYIPAVIGRYTKLKSLNIASNQIVGIDKAMSGLLNLRELNLSYNKLEEFPASTLHLPKLEKLLLAHNKIKTLPAMDCMYQLKELDLSENDLHAISDDPTLSARFPVSLEKLNLSKAKLEDIEGSDALPEHMGALHALTHLIVSSNPHLKRLPIAYGSFKTAGPDKVISLKRSVTLTVEHQGTSVVQGLRKGGRLGVSAHLDDSDSDSDVDMDMDTGIDGNDREADTRRYSDMRQRESHAPTGAAPQRAMPGPVYGADPGGYPPPVGTSGPYTTPPSMPNAGGAFPPPGGAQASTSAPGWQMPQAAIGQTSQQPGMQQSGFGPYAGPMDHSAWLSQLGKRYVELYLAQMSAAAGLPQYGGQPFMPYYGAGQLQQAYAAAGLQQTAPAAQFPVPPVWATPPAAANPPMQTRVYEGELHELIQKQNHAILRNEDARTVFTTLPAVMDVAAVDVLVLKIKQEEYAIRRPVHETRYAVGVRLLDVARGLYRQHLIDAIAKREARNRADPRVDERSLSLTYQACLAASLDLPGPTRGLVAELDGGTMRRDLFEGILPPENLIEEYRRVEAEVKLRETADPSGRHFEEFLYKQPFWQKYQAEEAWYRQQQLYWTLR